MLVAVLFMLFVASAYDANLLVILGKFDIVILVVAIFLVEIVVPEWIVDVLQVALGPPIEVFNVLL